MIFNDYFELLAKTFINKPWRTNLSVKVIVYLSGMPIKKHDEADSKKPNL